MCVCVFFFFFFGTYVTRRAKPCAPYVAMTRPGARGMRMYRGVPSIVAALGSGLSDGCDGRAGPAVRPVRHEKQAPPLLLLLLLPLWLIALPLQRVCWVPCRCAVATHEGDVGVRGVRPSAPTMVSLRSKRLLGERSGIDRMGRFGGFRRNLTVVELALAVVKVVLLFPERRGSPGGEPGGGGSQHVVTSDVVPPFCVPISRIRGAKRPFTQKGSSAELAEKSVVAIVMRSRTFIMVQRSILITLTQLMLIVHRAYLSSSELLILSSIASCILYLSSWR